MQYRIWEFFSIFWVLKNPIFRPLKVKKNLWIRPLELSDFKNLQNSHDKILLLLLFVLLYQKIKLCKFFS